MTEVTKDLVPEIWCDRQACKMEDTEDPSLIPWPQLTLNSLPEAIRCEENLTFITTFGKRVVQINVLEASRKRSDNFKMKECPKWQGSGFVIFFLQRFVIIATNKHVLFDDFEVKHSEVTFFRDGSRASKAITLSEGSGVHTINIENELDLTLAVYQIRGREKEYLQDPDFTDCVPKLCKPQPSAREQGTYVCIIHHPMGMTKQVSFGKILKEGDELFYDATTQGGSSGAPVLTFSTCQENNTTADVLSYHIGRKCIGNYGRKRDACYLVNQWVISLYNEYLQKKERRLSEAGQIMPLDHVVSSCHDVGIITFGDFVFTTGIRSPIRIDLRTIALYPSLLETICKYIWTAVSSVNHSFATVCGLAFRGIPLATVLGCSHRLPVVSQHRGNMHYKVHELMESHPAPGSWSEENGATSMKKDVTSSKSSEESEVEKNVLAPVPTDDSEKEIDLVTMKRRNIAGDHCLVVSDVANTGASLLATVTALRETGFKVEHAVVFVDREQGAREVLEKHKVQLHSVCSMMGALEILQEQEKITLEQVEKIEKHKDESKLQAKRRRTELSYEERAKCCSNSVTKKLLEIMYSKKSNLAVAVSLDSSRKVLDLVDKIGPYVCAVKTCTAIFSDYNPDFPDRIRELADRHKFMVIEDRKFSDLPHYVALQYEGGLYKPVQWADIVTAHALPHLEVIKGLEQVARKVGKDRGCVLEAEMSSAHNPSKLAASHPSFVTGLISRSNVTSDPRLLLLAPGVRLPEQKGSSAHAHLTPHQAVTERGADVIVVGRGVTDEEDPVTSAKAFQKAGYEAYLERLP